MMSQFNQTNIHILNYIESFNSIYHAINVQQKLIITAIHISSQFHPQHNIM